MFIVRVGLETWLGVTLKFIARFRIHPFQVPSALRVMLIVGPITRFS